MVFNATFNNISVISYCDGHVSSIKSDYYVKGRAGTTKLNLIPFFYWCFSTRILFSIITIGHVGDEDAVYFRFLKTTSVV